MSDLGMGAVGLDSGSMMLGAVGGQLEKKENRAVRRLSDTQRKAQQAFQQNEMGMQQQDVNRGAYYSQQSNLGNANSEGMLHSSVPGANANNIEQDRQRRYNTIQRGRDFSASSFQNESDTIFHQRKAQDIQNTIGMMQGFLGGGAQGAASSYGGRQY